MPRMIPAAIVFAFASIPAGADVLFVPFQYVDVPAAIAAASSGDTVRVELQVSGGGTNNPGVYGYNFGRGIDLGGRAIAIDFNGSGSIQIDRAAIITLADASSLQFDASLQWSGTIVVPPGASTSLASTSTISSDQLTAQLLIGTGGRMNVLSTNGNLAGTIRLAPGAALYHQAQGSSTIFGLTVVGESGSTLSWSSTVTFNGALALLGGHLQTGPSFTLASGAASILNGDWIGTTIRATGGTLNISNSTVIASTLVLDPPARLFGSGQWFVDMTVGLDAQATFTANSTVAGAYLNDGRTVVQAGTLVIAGSLTNNGQIIGSFMGPRGPGGQAPELSITGDYIVSSQATVQHAGGSLRITGDADIAVSDGSRFDLATGSLTVGAPGGTADLETLSADLGSVVAGFLRGPAAFPIGRLTIGGTVRLVDNHENAPGAPDALYVYDLRIPAGASLQSGGRRIYYRTLSLLGQVDEPANLVRVNFCTADFNGSGTLTVQDLFDFLNAYFASDPRADINGVGGTTVQDIFDYLAAYFAGCP